MCCALVRWYRTVIFFNGFSCSDRREPVLSAASAVDVHGRGCSADASAESRTGKRLELRLRSVLTSSLPWLNKPWATMAKNLFSHVHYAVRTMDKFDDIVVNYGTHVAVAQYTTHVYKCMNFGQAWMHRACIRPNIMAKPVIVYILIFYEHLPRQVLESGDLEWARSQSDDRGWCRHDFILWVPSLRPWSFWILNVNIFYI